MGLKLYNTLTRQVEEFQPREEGKVTMYNCGPTVYWRMQVGNLRAYANWDVLHRALLYLGYDVDRIVNFTDVGHMTEDDDFGEDKIEETARKEGKDPETIANYFIKTVLEDFAALNYLHPDGTAVDPKIDPTETAKHGWARASDHIEEMIEMNKAIEASGYTYETDQALYFDVMKWDDYTKLSGQKLDDKLVGVRDEVNVDPEKKHPADFVLWMKRKGKYEKHIQHWDSPWGDGFPGWHIECSAMGCKYLGEYIDIHTGGVDHIPVHHTNERAQNFGAFGHEVVNIWMHNEFLTGKGSEKLSKSKGNAMTLDEIVEQGFDPLDLRYYFSSIQHRQPIQFSTEGLEGAKSARLSINNKVAELAKRADDKGQLLDMYVNDFKEALSEDLNMSKAYAVLSELLKSSEKPENIVATVVDFDRVLGLRLDEVVEEAKRGVEVPTKVQQLLDARTQARNEKDFEKSDLLRDQIRELGYDVLDTVEGQQVKKV